MSIYLHENLARWPRVKTTLLSFISHIVLCCIVSFYAFFHFNFLWGGGPYILFFNFYNMVRLRKHNKYKVNILT